MIPTPIVSVRVARYHAATVMLFLGFNALGRGVSKTPCWPVPSKARLYGSVNIAFGGTIVDGDGATSAASLMLMMPLYEPLKPFGDASSASEPLASSSFQ